MLDRDGAHTLEPSGSGQHNKLFKSYRSDCKLVVAFVDTHLASVKDRFENSQMFLHKQQYFILAGEYIYKYKIHWQKSFVVANPWSHGIDRLKKVNSNGQNDNISKNDTAVVGMNGDHSI